MLAVEARGLTKDYDIKKDGQRAHLRAVDNLDLAINKSEIYSLLGPNGAGKTTTTRLLTSILQPSVGGAKILGYDIVEDASTVRSNVGLLTETPALYERLTVRQNLEFIARLYDIPKEDIKPRVEELVDLFDLSDKIDLPSGSLSKGMRQKVAIARAMIHDPPVIFLDEPTASLAPESAKIVREQIMKLSKLEARTFFICTHNLFEAERLSSRVGIINHGKLIAEGSPEQLRDLRKDETMTVFRFSVWDDVIQNFFQERHYEVLEIKPERKSISIFINDIEKETPTIIEELIKQNFPMFEVRHEYPTLERIYLDLVQSENLPRNQEEESS
ncbi:MAG: Daunorubicin/doxorubicin resistance ATP-binding protein DrrA [Candidatus Heimdallarchaeota archaeon AB_125]|nr:MAG: Daunorubicin/doxorubicin resistance ATP-binding protein DrrA [Candidatus Heimdallarchaeota archaeon AB_125]